MCERCQKQNTTFDGANISHYNGKMVVSNLLVYETGRPVPDPEGLVYGVAIRTPESADTETLNINGVARGLMMAAIENCILVGLDPKKEFENVIDILLEHMLRGPNGAPLANKMLAILPDDLVDKMLGDILNELLDEKPNPATPSNMPIVFKALPPDTIH